MGETQKGEGKNNTENGEGEGTNAVKLAATQNQLLEGRGVTIKEEGNEKEEREMQWIIVADRQTEIDCCIMLYSELAWD